MSSPQPPPINYLMPTFMEMTEDEFIVSVPNPLSKIKTCSRCYALVHDDFQLGHQDWHETEDAWAEPQPEG